MLLGVTIVISCYTFFLFELRWITTVSGACACRLQELYWEYIGVMLQLGSQW